MSAPPLWEPAGRAPSDRAVEVGPTRLSWADLEARTNAAGRGLLGFGLAPGDHVTLVAGNRVGFLDVVIGAQRAGLVVTPLKTSWTAGEVEHVLDDAGSRVVVTDTPAGRDAAGRRGLPVVDLLAGYEDWLAGQDPAPHPAAACGYRMSYTSGTTGRPKGVVYASSGRQSFTDGWRAAAQRALAMHLPRDGVHLVVSQLFHGAPLTFGLGVLAAGATLRVLGAWDPGAALRELARLDVTSTCVVPTMFRQWLALPAAERATAPGPALACVLHGGEPCPPSVKQAMLDWFGPVLVEYFGYTEGGLSVATSAEWTARPGTVGRPLGGQEAVILAEDGRRLPPGEVGRVHFVGAAGPPFRYLGDEEKTRAAYHGDAYTAGDLGWMDADGYLYLAGRTADVIVCAGQNVYPAEVEAALTDVDGVRDLAVVGGPDPVRGESPVLFVAVRDDAADVVGRLRSAAADRLAGYKRPREVVVVEEIPRDPTGKLLRGPLRDRLW